MTEKYKLPSVEEILNAATTEEGRDNIVFNFRTKTDDLSIYEALAVKERLDAEVAELVDRIMEAQAQVRDGDDCELQDLLWGLKDRIIYSYGYDDYDYAGWINSSY